MNKEPNMKFQSETKKKLRPYIIGILSSVLVILSVFTVVKLVDLNDLKIKDGISLNKDDENLENGGYISVRTKIGEGSDVSEEMTAYVEKHYNERGAFTYRENGKSYVIISAGKVTDDTGYAITYDAPEYDDIKDRVDIFYEFYSYKASEHQKQNKPDFVILEIKDVKNVVITESKNGTLSH